MKKGYYLNQSCRKDELVVAPGVENKIVQQISVFSNHYDMTRIEISQRKGEYIRKRLPFYSGTYGVENILESIKDPDFLYMRKCRIERGIYGLLRKLKEKYQGCKIIIELPTYPYDRDFFEGNGGILAQFPFYIKDVFYRNRLDGIVDRFVIYGNLKEIFGIKTISTINGIEVERFQLKRAKGETEDKSVTLLAVANFQKAHGYERILEGIRKYYIEGGRREIRLLMVGEGAEKHYYENLVSQYGIKNKVKFLGQKIGAELDKCYECADIALGCFGQYKFGHEGSSALKIREYLARGIPIISGCKEDILTDSKVEFYMEFPNDSSNIDMKAVLNFYDSLKDKKNLSKHIRQFALEKVSMDMTLSPIINYINT